MLLISYMMISLDKTVSAHVELTLRNLSCCNFFLKVNAASSVLMWYVLMKSYFAKIFICALFEITTDLSVLFIVCMNEREKFIVWM